MKLGTTEAGVLICFFAVVLLVVHIISGKGDPVQTYVLAGGMLAAGYSSIKSADASMTVQKHELKDLGMVGRELGIEVKEREKQQSE